MSAQFQYDKGKYCAEVSFTTDDGLIGVRGLYNFGKDFDDSYEAMLKEGRAQSGALQDETVLLDNPDSAFIDLEQAHGKEEAVASSDKTEEILRLSENTSERKGYLGEETPEDLSASPERIRGYWSAGAEIYYSATEKLGGGKKRCAYTAQRLSFHFIPHPMAIQKKTAFFNLVRFTFF